MAALNPTRSFELEPRSVLPLFEVDPSTVRPLERGRGSDPHCEGNDHSGADTGVEGYDSVSKTVTAPSTSKKQRKRKHRHGRNNKSTKQQPAAKLPEQDVGNKGGSGEGLQAQNERTARKRAATITTKEGKGGSERIDDAKTKGKKLVLWNMRTPPLNFGPWTHRDWPLVYQPHAQDLSLVTQEEHGRNRKTNNERESEKKAGEKDGGSRLVANAMTRVCERNDRSCLCDAIISILPSNRNKWLVGLAIMSSMPKYGDTSVLNVAGALATYALKMKRVSGNYIKKGGASYNILQEHNCSLILGIKLTSVDGIPMNHFVGWDGAVIYDHPFASKVSNIKDRASPEMSNAVFDKLYKKTEFSHWQITAVYDLLDQE